MLRSAANYNRNGARAHSQEFAVAMNRRLWVLVVFTLTVCFVSGSQREGLQDRPARRPATDFSLTDATGAHASLSGLRGKVVLLDFWATWCAGCKEEMPWFIEFQKKYARQGLASVGVALDDEGWEKVRPYLRDHPVNYPIVVADAAFAAKYGITGLPTTLLIDRRGQVAEVHVGKVEKESFEARIQTLLSEK